jgi:hypothetical protein
MLMGGSQWVRKGPGSSLWSLAWDATEQEGHSSLKSSLGWGDLRKEWNYAAFSLRVSVKCRQVSICGILAMGEAPFSCLNPLLSSTTKPPKWVLSNKLQGQGDWPRLHC